MAVILTVFSALMALVSLALYRVEREETGGRSNAGPPSASSDDRRS